MSRDMAQRPPTFTRLTAHEALDLAAEADAAKAEGRDPRAALKEKLSILKERRQQRQREEWLEDS